MTRIYPGNLSEQIRLDGIAKRAPVIKTEYGKRKINLCYSQKITKAVDGYIFIIKTDNYNRTTREYRTEKRGQKNDRPKQSS